MNKEMALNPSPKFNPDSPIPNNPFYYPSSTLLQGPYHPVIITASSGLVINADGTITVTGGGGGGGIAVSPLYLLSLTPEASLVLLSVFKMLQQAIKVRFRSGRISTSPALLLASSRLQLRLRE